MTAEIHREIIMMESGEEHKGSQDNVTVRHTLEQQNDVVDDILERIKNTNA